MGVRTVFNTVTYGIIYIYVYYIIYYSAAWRATSGRWAFRRALHYGWAYMLTLWGKEDTEEEAVPWELWNIKFQVG